MIDSVAFHFRHGFKPEDMPHRTRLLARMAQVLQSVAARHNVAVRACPKFASARLRYRPPNPLPKTPPLPPSQLAPQIVIVNQMTTLVNAKRDSDGNTRVSAALGVFACASYVPLRFHPRAPARPQG